MIKLITKKLKDLFINKYSKSFARHAMTVASGWLLAIGLAPEVVGPFKESGTLVLAGVLAWAVSQLWSWLDKRKQSGA
jgi:hypothetical protein